MKKAVKEFDNKSIADLVKEASRSREEIATGVLNRTVNPGKDTNLIVKKKKRLAVLLTVLTKKREEEAFSKKTS